MWTKRLITSDKRRFTNTGTRLLPSYIGIFACILIGLAHTAEPAHAADSQTNRLIIKFKDPETGKKRQLSAQELRPLADTLGLSIKHLRRASGQHQILSLPNPITLEKARQLARTLENLDIIETAEPDRKRYPQLVPNDTDYANQWSLFEAAGGINAENAWDITTGSSDTVIAVLDTGILLHTDFNGRILSGYDFISDIDAANDGDGRDNDPTDPGDFVTAAESATVGGPFEGCPVSDSIWHGTLIAGQIAANTNNNSGIAGIDHQASILPVRVLGKCGGFTSDVADAIRWAAGIDDPALPPVNPNPASIINLSLGGLGACSTVEQAAINDAIAANAVVITSAGNDATQASNSAPGNCENVINVASSTRQGGETFYTNFGSAITLSAPGGNDTASTDGIYLTSNDGSTIPVNENFEFVIGTSFSAPAVSGTVALMHSVRSALSPTDIRFILETSAKSFPAGTTDGFGDCTTDRCGAGILDAAAAVIAARDGTLGGAGNGLIRMAQESVCVTEQDGSVILNVIRIGGNGTVSVRVDTREISATSGIDFSAVSDVLIWNDGDTSPRQIEINITPDTIVEGSEFFRVALTDSSPSALIDSPDATTVTIISTNGNTARSCSSTNQSGNGAGLYLPAICLLLLFAKVITRNNRIKI